MKAAPEGSDPAIQEPNGTFEQPTGQFRDAPGVFAFGPFSLDPMRRTLLRDGVQVPLTARLFETLLYLVRNPQRLVGRDELETAVWGGRIVEEGNLQKAISSLRKVLQTGSAGETYILTIAGRGFRFTAPVTLEQMADPVYSNAAFADARSDPAPGRHEAWHYRTRIYAGLAAILALGFLVKVFLPSRSADTVTFAPPAQSVAVLPFVNVSSDAREDYFSDGLTDELINTLSRVEGLHVAARTSAFTFKGSMLTMSDIGRRLDVAAVLEGAVRRNGQRLHITVQLIDTRTGFQFWSRSYDRDRVADDMLNVQAEIARTVAGSLKIKLMQADAGRLTVGGTHDGRAFDAYLRGTTNDRAFGEANIRQAIADFSEAIRLDPTYAQAFAARAAAHNHLIVYSDNADRTDDRLEAAAAAADADVAIDLAPTLAEAHRVKGLILFDALAFEGATTELAIASDLAPNDTMIEATRGTIEARLGHDDIAITAARRAVALDPLNPDTYQRLGEALYWTHQFNEALAAFGHATAVDRHPSRINLSWMASAYLAKGDAAAAERICTGGSSWTDDACLAMAYHALGRQSEAEKKFSGLFEKFGDRLAYVYAEIFAQWGRSVDATHWLGVAYALNDDGLSEMKVSPFLSPIRDTAEYRDIERRLHFPP